MIYERADDARCGHYRRWSATVLFAPPINAIPFSPARDFGMGSCGMQCQRLDADVDVTLTKTTDEASPTGKMSERFDHGGGVGARGGVDLGGDTLASRIEFAFIVKH